MEFLKDLLSLVTGPSHLATGVRVTALLLLGLPAIAVLTRRVRLRLEKSSTAQVALVAAKAVRYTGASVVVLLVLHQLGFGLAPLLGAAGILGVAVGFASQTSVSNLISGLFLIGEGAFLVGEVVTVDGITGEVLSVDLLSIKLRTFDNKLVRIPNETIIKSNLTNISRFPIRRVDVKVSVAYQEDLGRVRRVLEETAARNALVLVEPEPLFVFQGFGSSSIDLLFAVWTVQADYLSVLNGIHMEIKAAFDAAGIEIPFPHVSVYTGSATSAMPVRLTSSPPAAPPVEEPE